MNDVNKKYSPLQFDVVKIEFDLATSVWDTLLHVMDLTCPKALNTLIHTIFRDKLLQPSNDNGGLIYHQQSSAFYEHLLHAYNMHDIDTATNVFDFLYTTGYQLRNQSLLRVVVPSNLIMDIFKIVWAMRNPKSTSRQLLVFTSSHCEIIDGSKVINTAGRKSVV